MKSKYFSKYILLVSICYLVLSSTSIPTYSQTNSAPSFLDRFSIGAGAGLNFSSMTYSDPDLAAYKSALFPRGGFGLFAEIDLTKNISIRPEMYFIGKGQLIDGDVYYKFASDYVDWRLPILLNFGNKNSVRPYLMVAPGLCFATGGYIENEKFSLDITDASVYPVDIELKVGVGLKIPIKLDKMLLIAGTEVSYGIGLIDNYSDKEIVGSADAINRAFYSIDGDRKNRGISVTASIAIPFSNFKREKKHEPQKSLFAQEKERQVEPDKPEPLKNCYTIEEINTLIDAEKNVDNKVICMNNLNFEFNKSTLDKDSKTYLNNVVMLLDKVPSMKMKISGHTDNVGADEYNKDLSKKRAAAVHDFLISKGISKDRLSYEYFGASRPLVPNDSDANRAKNRRVEFAIIKK
jgi:OOP family OmpA-OmpF porin